MLTILLLNWEEVQKWLIVCSSPLPCMSSKVVGCVLYPPPLHELKGGGLCALPPPLHELKGGGLCALPPSPHVG